MGSPHPRGLVVDRHQKRRATGQITAAAAHCGSRRGAFSTCIVLPVSNSENRESESEIENSESENESESENST